MTSEGSLRLPSGLSQCIVQIYHPVFFDLGLLSSVSVQSLVFDSLNVFQL